MKKRTYYYLLSTFAFAFWLSSCSLPSSTKEKTEVAAAEMENAASEAMDAVESAVSGLGNEIEESQALKWRVSFDSLVEANPKMEFPCGFVLSSEDIKGILGDPDPTNEEHLFSMIGYDPSKNEFDLIFYIKDPLVEGTPYKYYDFTQPCPKYCPGLLGINKYTPQATIEDLEGTKGWWFGRHGLSSKLPEGESYLELQKEHPDADIQLQNCNGTCENVALFQTCGKLEGAPACPPLPSPDS